MPPPHHHHHKYKLVPPKSHRTPTSLPGRSILPRPDRQLTETNSKSTLENDALGPDSIVP